VCPFGVRTQLFHGPDPWNPSTPSSLDGVWGNSFTSVSMLSIIEDCTWPEVTPGARSTYPSASLTSVLG
jgi:hypothetical protein